MPLINCEICLQLIWSKKCFIVAGTAANQIPERKVTDAKLYISVVTLSTQENIILLNQLESGFKVTINWNKYLFKPTSQARNRYLDDLIDASVQGVNRLFDLLFKDADGWESDKQ